MINVNAEEKVFNLDGSVPRLLVELEYIFADLFTKMYISERLSTDVIDELFREAKENGVNAAWDVIYEK